MCGRRIDYNKCGVFEELVSRIRAGDCRFATAAAGGAVPCVRRKLRAWRTVRTLPQSVRGGGGGFGPVFCENRRTGGRSWRKRVCGTGVQPLFRGLFLCPAPCGVREYADVVRMFAAKRALRNVRILAGSEIRGGSPRVDPAGRVRVRAECPGRMTDRHAVAGAENGSAGRSSGR